MSVSLEKTKERIMRIYGEKDSNHPKEEKIEKLKSENEVSIESKIDDPKQKMIDFIKLSAQLRSEINKTTDPMKALELSLQCVSIYLDDNDFFYRSNRNRLIGGS